MHQSEPTDRVLVESWRAGDRVAGDQLLRRYERLLHHFFARKVANNVDELVQRTLVACVQAIGRFEDRSSFKTYLLGIAQNQFLMSLRSGMPTALTADVLSTGRDENPSQLVVVREELRLLFRALVELTPEFVLVLKMFYWDGLSVDEIAGALEIRPGTVKSRLARSRAALKAKLSHLDPANQHLLSDLSVLAGSGEETTETLPRRGSGPE